MKLTWQRRHLHLKHPFLIARKRDEKSTAKTALLVRIEHAGHVGLGEAAPIGYYHQSLDSAEAALAEMAGMLGNDPFALDAILDPIWERFASQSAAVAAVDGALHDLIGKLLGVPVWKLLGLDPRRAPLTSFTIGIDDLEVIARKVAEATTFPILKVKVGTDQDDAILATIRKVAPDKILRVDANCGWNSANVLDRCRQLARYDIELIEQPTPAGDHDALPAVRAAGIAPIIADESCVGVESVLACAGVFDGINIKLSKCGGIRRAIQMIHTARSVGLKIMLGCMVETSVGIAAAAHLAPTVDYIDLDGHLLLADDPFEGLGGHDGRLTLTDRPGLGIVETAH
jgi:L-alanine-DL-glutamate epimerase-like enolase superfamily enzyme